ncbi:MAG: biotin transporter BioY [Actinobacteria bacterium]|jgi:biotin transport system substrate-specific component|nr:biotin transporter BioY [Actinomycetota bacterium]NBP52929.1 biotin transporter BioY [Actinomycetota bacterium]
MTAEAISPSTPAVLADLVPGLRSKTAVRSAALIVGFALLTAALAQVKISLGFTPVPITGQTLAVLLAGTSLGMSRGGASQLVYWLMGLVGLPFYSGGESGWESGTGATLGYLMGFIVAAAVVGYLAERRHDRQVLSSLSAMAFGTVIIYTMGALWLAYDLGVPVANGEQNAITMGVTPFLVGDLIKMTIAGLAAPAVWATVSKK